MNKYAVPCTDYVGESGSFMIDPHVKIVKAEDYLGALVETFRLLTIQETDFTEKPPTCIRNMWHKNDKANEDEEGWVIGDPVLIEKGIKG